LWTSTVVYKTADGKWTRRSYQQKPGQQLAAIQARRDAFKSRQQGTAPTAESPLALAAPAEIDGIDCDNHPASAYALWLWPQTGASGNNRCCVYGGGSDSISSMCGFSEAKSLYAGISGGLYGDFSYCGGETFAPEEVQYVMNCDAEWVQHDF
jgi:hypothetical protein